MIIFIGQYFIESIVFDMSYQFKDLEEESEEKPTRIVQSSQVSLEKFLRIKLLSRYNS